MNRVRVERALRLLPAVDAMEPLRALLVSTPRPDEQSRWSSSGPYLTIGKHGVDVDLLRRRVDDLLPRVMSHMSALYRAYVAALSAAETGDGPAIVGALVDGGDAEERVHRTAQAAAWYEVGFRIAAELGERGPEIDVLDRLGRTAHARTRYDDAARYHQRALVLAEAVFDHGATIRACVGLGNAAVALAELGGANAWFLRALRHAESAVDSAWIGTVEHHLGMIAWRQGDSDRARSRLRRARELLESVGANAELSRVLCTVGEIECAIGNPDSGIAAGREALAWTERPGLGDALKVEILVRVSELYVLAGKLLDAEQELRRAEALAIDHRFGGRLIEVYIAMGRLCARRGDETGFVFFEQAGELCRALAPVTTLEGRLYEEYGNFRLRFGERDEGSAHLERARQIFEAAGDVAALARLRDEIAALSA
jgi:tetratricopeptide (TPR) repeat protein